jgi:hypothetical protein
LEAPSSTQHCQRDQRLSLNRNRRDLHELVVWRQRPPDRRPSTCATEATAGSAWRAPARRKRLPGLLQRPNLSVDRNARPHFPVPPIFQRTGILDLENCFAKFFPESNLQLRFLPMKLSRSASAAMEKIISFQERHSRHTSHYAQCDRPQEIAASTHLTTQPLPLRFHALACRVLFADRRCLREVAVPGCANGTLGCAGSFTATMTSWPLPCSETSVKLTPGPNASVSAPRWTSFR